MRQARGKVNVVRFPAAIAAALLLALCALPVLAEPTTQPSTQPSSSLASEPVVQTWFDELSHSDPTVRSDAMIKLMGLNQEGLLVLQKVVERNAPLAAGQESILKHVVAQAYLAEQPYIQYPEGAFLGVQLMDSTSYGDADPQNAGVYIFKCMPGFAGGRAFQPGDLILSIKDRPDASISNTTAFRMVVGGMKRGDTVTFQILRKGQVMWVPIKLGAHPDDAWLSKLNDDRLAAAQQYWDTQFAPLLVKATKVTSQTTQ